MFLTDAIACTFVLAIVLTHFILLSEVLEGLASVKYALLLLDTL